jgi:hypothetical protein
VDGGAAAVDEDGGIAPGEITHGTLLFGVLDSPSSYFVGIATLDDLPFGTVGPVLFLGQEAAGC